MLEPSFAIRSQWSDDDYAVHGPPTKKRRRELTPDEALALAGDLPEGPATKKILSLLARDAWLASPERANLINRHALAQLYALGQHDRQNYDVRHVPVLDLPESLAAQRDEIRKADDGIHALVTKLTGVARTLHGAGYEAGMALVAKYAATLHMLIDDNLVRRRQFAQAARAAGHPGFSQPIPAHHPKPEPPQTLHRIQAAIDQHVTGAATMTPLDVILLVEHNRLNPPVITTMRDVTRTITGVDAPEEEAAGAFDPVVMAPRQARNSKKQLASTYYDTQLRESYRRIDAATEKRLSDAALACYKTFLVEKSVPSPAV